MVVGAVGGAIAAAYLALTRTDYWWAAPAGVAVVAGLFWFVWWVDSWCTTLVVTDRRVRLRRGLLSKSVREIAHDKIQDIQVQQTFPERVLRVGSIGISSSGEAGYEIFVAGVGRPERIRETIDRYRGV